jgi:recombinational DNA repair protein (RecF pathway)
VDIGSVGEEEGNGGKYLVVAPGYKSIRRRLSGYLEPYSLVDGSP